MNRFNSQLKKNRMEASHTRIIRNNDKSLSVVVYRKPTHTDQYLNFKSNHQKSNIESVISSLFTRAENVITDTNDLTTEKARMVNVIISNDYDMKTIKSVQNKIERRKTITKNK